MTDDTWMRGALVVLIEHLDDVGARHALTDATVFDEVRALVEAEPTLSVPVGDRGDNLLRALLALRVKFPADEARAKLETNLAMRRPGSAASREEL